MSKKLLPILSFILIFVFAIGACTPATQAPVAEPPVAEAPVAEAPAAEALLLKRLPPKPPLLQEENYIT